MSGSGLTPAKRAVNTAIGFVGLLGVAWTIVAVLTSDHADPRWLTLTLLLTIGISFTATGMYAWARRPDSWFGLQMSLTGLSWFLISLSASNDDVLFTLGWALNSLYAALVAHTLLAYPTGRLHSRAERIVVGVAYAVVLLGPALLLTVTPTPADLPRNVLLVDADAQISDLGQTLLRGVLLATAVVVTGMLVRRWQRATSPQRRLLAPVLWCGVTTTTALALSLAGQLANLPDDVLSVFDFAGLFVFASVPIAFISGIVRQNLSSGQSVGRLVARLGDGPGRGPNRLRDALASALRDRSLAIAYWLPASGPAGAAGRGATSTPAARRSRCPSPAAAAPSRSSSTTAAASRR